MSRSIFICLDDVSFYGGNSSFPVFDSGRSNPITTKEAVIILKSDIKSSSICNKTPAYIKNNVSFIVNAEKLSHWKDIRTDMISRFIGSGTKTLYFDECNDELVSSSCSFHSLMPKRIIYNHKVYHDFHKIIICIWDQDLNEPLSNFYVQYYFDNGEHHVDFSMPDSSRNKKKSQQTKFSVRNNVKTLFHKGMKGKAIFERLVKSSGGFEEASTSADLPNSYNQIYD